MQVIGEKINGTRKEIGQAIRERDAAAIQDLAVAQSAAGAAWLDVNAGTNPKREPEDLIWLVETIQAVVDTPLSLDSANPAALEAAIAATTATPMINSVSGESDRPSMHRPIPTPCRPRLAAPGDQPTRLGCCRRHSGTTPPSRRRTHRDPRTRGPGQSTPRYSRPPVSVPHPARIGGHHGHGRSA